MVSTRSSSPTRREDTVVRVLALGAVAVALGGVLVSSQAMLPAPSVVVQVGVTTRVEEQLPSYVVAPAVVLDPTPTDHPATGSPRRVQVPDLAVDVPVVPVGLAGDVLVPPSDPQQLGWWTGGAEPGALVGTAVLTGHTVSTGGGALDDLHTLEVGDRVVVVTDEGRIRYAVTSVATYSKTALARVATRVFSRTSPGRLVLVTCTDFDGREYLGNTLVFAAPER